MVDSRTDGSTGAETRKWPDDDGLPSSLSACFGTCHLELGGANAAATATATTTAIVDVSVRANVDDLVSVSDPSLHVKLHFVLKVVKHWAYWATYY